MKKLLLLSALSAVCAFSACNDDDEGKSPGAPTGNVVNVRIDPSRVQNDDGGSGRPNKTDRYRILLDGQDVIAPVEQHAVVVNRPGTYPVVVMSNLLYWNFDGPVFTLPLNADGYFVSDKGTDLSDQFGVGRDTVTVEKDQVVNVDVQLASIPQIALGATLDTTGIFRFPELAEGRHLIKRVSYVTVEMSGLNGAWDFLNDVPVGEPVVMNRGAVSDGKKKNWDYTQMFLGFNSAETPRMKVRYEFYDTKEVLERELIGKELIRNSKIDTFWMNKDAKTDPRRFKHIFRDTLRWNDPNLPVSEF